MKNLNYKELKIFLVALFSSIAIMSYGQNINIPEYWIHADSIRVRAIHVGDSSMVIGTVPGFPGNNIVTLQNTNSINFGFQSGAGLNSNFPGVNIGTTTPSTLLHIHDAGNGPSPFTHYTNVATGTGTLNGFKVGIASNGSADLIQSEALPIANFVS